MNLSALLTLSLDNKVFANPRRIALLEQIAATGSLNQGAKLAGISYKAAWDAVNAMNTALEQPVVTTEKGGKGGGGARLTEFGERLLKVYSLTEQVQGMALEALLDDRINMNGLLDLMAHFSLNTSARNQLSGRIVALDSDGLNDRVQIALAGGQQVSASITHASTERLKLDLDEPVLLLFKAPVVVVSSTPSAQAERNNLAGTLTALTVEGDKTELTLDIGGNARVYSVMASEQVDELKPKLGERYFAQFDAAQAIVASMG